MLSAVSCGYIVERVTRIELALSAWESDRSGAADRPDQRIRYTVSDRHRPCGTAANGPRMARGTISLDNDRDPHSRGPLPTPPALRTGSGAPG
jgi:hypothetical protein